MDSLAADKLGTTGLPGDVNRHLWQKLSGVLMLSLVQGGLQLGTAALSDPGTGGTSLSFYQFQNGGDQVANTLLQLQIGIPDTLNRDQGLACTVFVARDLDFSDVYRLEVR
jgi:type IV secretion system protein VirB10